MSYILTLVSSSINIPLIDKYFQDIGSIIEYYNLEFKGKIQWLDEKIAAEIGLSGNIQSSLIMHLRDFLAKDRIDFFITKDSNRKKKLLLADMDSTIVTGETLDELAQYAGIKEEVAQITKRAMEGEIDFHDALKERVALLKGLKVTALYATLDETKLSDGARVLVSTMRRSGSSCVLVSGGFTFFTNPIALKCGFNFNHGNELEIIGDSLSGNVIEPILDKYSKVEFLEYYIGKFDLSLDDCLTIGDGANDLPMLKMAGLGIGYHPKDTVKSEITNCILYGDLTAALYAQGYCKKDFEIN